MKLAAIIPVKTFANAKTRLDIPQHKRELLCKLMLEEVTRTTSISPQINETVIVTKEHSVQEIADRYDTTIIHDTMESGVNNAVDLADNYLLNAGFDASLVIPQDIPYIQTQDIDFMLNYKMHPNFVVIVPSRRFDGTNALIRMPLDIMKTHYDQDSYKNHMNTAKQYTRNVAMIFVRRIMLDVDTRQDLELLLAHPEKQHIKDKIQDILGLSSL